MKSAQVEFKTRVPEKMPHQFPYYRLTKYMNDVWDENGDLVKWFRWIESKGISCAIAMGVDPGTNDKLAVWVYGNEYPTTDELGNLEEMGRIVQEYRWPDVIRMLGRSDK